LARQNSPRMRKVNELIREVVADAVPGLKDPRIGFVTITGAETSPDLRYAIVYYSAMGSEQEKKDTAAGLKSAIPHLQREIGGEVRLRNTPKLEFRIDPAIDEGLKINEMVKDLDFGEPEDQIQDSRFKIQDPSSGIQKSEGDSGDRMSDAGFSEDDRRPTTDDRPSTSESGERRAESGDEVASADEGGRNV
jgi:ribosome-binding factor A